MVIRFFQSLLLIGLLTPGLVLAQKSLSAGVDRTLLEIGDIIQLTLTANFQTTKEPNFNQLEPDFEVLGTQASSQLRIINGQYTGTTQWDAQILATKTGHLTIPAFEVDGYASKPIDIEVNKSSQKISDFKVSFLEAEIDQVEPYVQSQVIFTLRYYHLGQLVRGSIDPPKFENILNERLRNQQTYERKVNGRIYRVYEWVYALFPQTSGELILPGQSFEGSLLYERKLRLVKEQSAAIQLNVRPIPDSYPKNHVWLPAKSITLKQEWTQEEELQVGDTLGRRIQIEAVGLKSSQLPPLDWPANENYRIYKDPASQNDHLVQNGLSSIKAQDFMMVLQKQGQTDFTEVEIPWWNTQTDQLEIAKLPSKSFQVALNENNPLLFETQNQALEQNVSHPKILQNLWFWSTLVLTVLWIITLIMFGLQRKNKKLESAIDPHDQQRSVQKFDLTNLFQTSDHQLYIELQKWLKTHYQVDNWRTLATTNPKLFQLIQQLEQQLFNKNSKKSSENTIDTNELQHQLNALTTLQNNDQQPKSNNHDLKPLYPE